MLHAGGEILRNGSMHIIPLADRKLVSMQKWKVQTHSAVH